MSQQPGIEHIAIAVADLEAATAFWRDVLGLREGHREVVADQGVEVQMLHAGAVRVELLRPLGPDTPVGRFLARRGPGLHHVALAVADCAAALAQVRAAGARTLQEDPVPGTHGSRVAFLHPASTGGVLVELVEGGGATAGEEEEEERT